VGTIIRTEMSSFYKSRSRIHSANFLYYQFSNFYRLVYFCKALCTESKDQSKEDEMGGACGAHGGGEGCIQHFDWET
jgi:hypothetical protein